LNGSTISSWVLTMTQLRQAALDLLAVHNNNPRQTLKPFHQDFAQPILAL
jgi:hypothetical protein